MRQKINLKILLILLLVFCTISVKSFAAEAIDINDTNIEIEESRIYTAKEINAKVTIRNKGKQLKYGKDYTVEYKDNINVGTGTAEITGIGKYTGKAIKNFEIIVAKVTSLYTGSQTEKGIMIKWDKPEEGIVNGYEVFMSEEKDGEYESFGTVPVSKETFGKTGLKTAKTYYFKVKTYVTFKGDKKYSEFSDVFESSTRPKTAKISSIKAQKDEVTLKWWKDSKVTGYEVYMSQNKDEEYKKVITLGQNKIKTYKLGGLKKGKTYFFKMRKYKMVGKNKVYSEYSPVKSIKIK